MSNHARTVSRTKAAIKAAETKRRNKKARIDAAHRAVEKRNRPHRKAHRTAKASEAALAAWAKDHGWYFLSFTKASGYPRNGIIDAVLIRIAPKTPDVLHVGLVQLKSGSAGLTADEWNRLNDAKGLVKIAPMMALYNGDKLSVEAAHRNLDDVFKVA